MANSENVTSEKSTKDGWDKLTALSALLASVLVPLTLGIVGQLYTASLQNRERTLAEDQEKRQWVQLGLDILRDAAIDPTIRKWAVDVVNKNSGGNIMITPAVETALVKNGEAFPQSTAQQSSLIPDAAPRGPRVDALQTRGVEALLERDLKTAISAYDDAYRLWPVYRNVDEIRKLLRGSRELSRQGNDEAWRALYRKIAGMDLRGVDADVVSRLKAAANP